MQQKFVTAQMMQHYTTCDKVNLELHDYHRDSRQEFVKVGGIFTLLHVFLLDASN